MAIFKNESGQSEEVGDIEQFSMCSDGHRVDMVLHSHGGWVRYFDHARRVVKLKAFIRLLLERVVANKWRPIKSAPKDGTPILIYCQVSGAMEARWQTEWLDRHNDLLDVYAVTHWMPLLPEPEANSSADSEDS